MNEKINTEEIKIYMLKNDLGIKGFATLCSISEEKVRAILEGSIDSGEFGLEDLVAISIYTGIPVVNMVEFL